MGGENRWVRRALDHVDARCDGNPLDRSVRLTLNFHPDRFAGGVEILDALATTGTYLSQFETGTSNGGLTVHPGGDRWLWEHRLFGGAYDLAPAGERPKYGALNHRHHSLGGAPRFGSSHFRLREHMLDRATFCFPDSAFDPTHVATSRHFALFRLVEAHDEILLSNPDEGGLDPLDGYVEAQIHGPILLADDVDALVLDPCFRGTAVEERASRLGVPVEWHEGRVLALGVLDAHPDYRGPAPVALGHAIARDGSIDARIIGEAARTGRHEAQSLKQLWHLTAQWGLPRQ